MREVPEAGLRSVLEAEHGIRWAYLFGSAARPGQPWRDLDVGVVVEPGWSLVRLGALATLLEAAAGSHVDLIDLGAAPARFTWTALREGSRLLVDRDPAARQLWEAERISAGIDYEPVYQAALEAWRDRLRNGTIGRQAG